MNECEYCGTDNELDAKECRTCGAPMEEVLGLFCGKPVRYGDENYYEMMTHAAYIPLFTVMR